MANVSSSNGQEGNVPKLRFPGFEGEWQNQKLIEMLYSRVEKQIPSEDAPLMAFTAEGGVETKGERYDRSYLVKSDKKLYKRTEYNDFIYSSNNLDVGSIGLNKYGTAVISDVYEIFSVKENTAPTFVSELIQRPHVLAEVLKYRQGCLYGQYRIYAEDFLKVLAYAPSFEEQTKIALFLELLDEKIAIQHKLVEALKKYKRGLLQAIFDKKSLIFPCKGNGTIPTKLSELLDFQNGINADASKYGQGVHYISVSDILKNNYIMYDFISGQINIDEKTLNSYNVTYGDILFQRSSETREDAGRSNVYLDKNMTATFGGFVIRGKKKGEYVPLYLKYLLDSSYVRKQIMRCAAGAQHINVSQEDISNIVVNLPSMATQKIIADFIFKIDNRILIEEKKIVSVTKFKNSLLQKLFI